MFLEIANRRGVPAANYLTAQPQAVDAILGGYFTQIQAGTLTPPRFPHAVYAAMWERSGAVEVMSAIAENVVAGQYGSRITRASQLWAQATDALFVRTPPPYSVLAAGASGVDAATLRHQLYQRLFGPFAGEVDPELPSGEDFPRLFGELIAMGLEGASNRNNTLGPNPTRPGQIARVARQLREQLADTRPAGMPISRDEYVAVATAGWAELTFFYNSPILVDLGATATTAAQRVERLAEVASIDIADDAVSVAVLLELARPMSDLLNLVETGSFEPARRAPALYLVPAARDAVEAIADVWETAIVAPKPASLPRRAGAGGRLALAS